MNYALLALTHTRDYRPSAYSKINNKRAHFRKLGQEVANQIEEMINQEIACLPATNSYIENLQRRMTAQATAREIALNELVYLPLEVPDPPG